MYLVHPLRYYLPRNAQRSSLKSTFRTSHLIPCGLSALFSSQLRGWHVQDANLLPDSQNSLFSGAMAMMQPQDTRQFIYILNEINPPAVPVQHAPGAVIPLEDSISPGDRHLANRTYSEPLVSPVFVLLTGYSSLNINNRCYPVGYLFFQIRRPSVHLSNPRLPSHFTSSGLPP